MLLPNGFGFAPNGFAAAGAPNGLGLDAPKAEHSHRRFKPQLSLMHFQDPANLSQRHINIPDYPFTKMR